MVKHKHRSEYPGLASYLAAHQAMGVFLYGELLLSRNKLQLELFHQVFDNLKEELDHNSKSVILGML